MHDVSGRPRTPDTWDARYVDGDMPWDAGEPSPYLVELIERIHAPRVLEIGCGTGTNAIWLAQQELTVIVTEVSTTAIALAREKAAEAGVGDRIDFREHDLFSSPPVDDGSVDLVFDRGVFHTFSEEQRRPATERIHAALVPGGLWLSIIGNADEQSEGRGPPRLTATEVISAVEPCFELQSIKAARFRTQMGAPLAWIVLMARRERS